ncbi:transketolase [Lentzea tibetensis]|uniref:Dihydrolipoamide acetyltransferase component of pyruvate dehydrogenase complex n=1 Tax=Lentzea tibetensis TaxID=2591470 RepID=A0A563ENI9_9PSEU|nr:2-oxo acid dehydrogenase subunit E2 [Lentzea tibetensis]TWP48834.1 transketolase [Lentzea tibetensis]
MTPAPRVVENLNRALHRLFAERADLHLLGEDVLDPYGGAFKVTKGLSSGFPDRVLTTPLSEAGIAGVAAGLAVAGDQVVLEAMFGDFAALMFDQILNMASKSVTMYGRPKAMRVLVRCPVGGNRGYGPTHSQSVQKHFMGIPNLGLYEATPFHDAYPLMAHALDHGPSILFEDKVLYTRRLFQDGVVSDHFRYSLVGGATGWAHVTSGAPADVVIICPGGVAHRALEAAEALREQGVSAHLLVPAQLYPLDVEPVLPLISGRVVVAEESTAGGTWGSDVAAVLHERLWGKLSAPVLRLSSADSIIPSARHLEERVLLNSHHIVTALGRDHCEAPQAVPEVTAGAPVTAPKLNNNDTTYLVLGWLVEDGAKVEPGTAILELETSKAIEEIEATEAGYLRIHVQQGVEVEVGALLAEIVGAKTAVAKPEVPKQRTHSLDRAQQGTAMVVSKAHQEVPAAFTAIEVRVDALLERLRQLSDETGAEVGVPEAVVKAVAGAHADFGTLFGSLVDDTTVALVDTPHVAVTLDAGKGLYAPVIRDCTDRSIVDISDDMMDFRMKAWRGEFAAAELTGGSITVSLNTDDDVLLVQPIVMWPQLCMLSVGGLRNQVVLEDDGPSNTTVVTLGLAYDHRVVNGAEAVAFLRAVADSLRKPDRLEKLVSL